MTDDLNSRRAVFVYEAARLHAGASGSHVVPEPFVDRDEAFRVQFASVVEMMCSDRRKSSPEELHEDWVVAYEEMGWRYGPVRDTVAKTHPDMIPFHELAPREQAKDEVFVALCEIARKWIPE